MLKNEIKIKILTVENEIKIKIMKFEIEFKIKIMKFENEIKIKIMKFENEIKIKIMKFEIEFKIKIMKFEIEFKIKTLVETARTRTRLWQSVSRDQDRYLEIYNTAYSQIAPKLWNVDVRNTVTKGQCYYPSMRTENKGLLALFFVRQERRIDYNFKWAITGTEKPISTISI